MHNYAKKVDKYLNLVYNYVLKNILFKGNAMNRKTARENAFILLFEKAVRSDEPAEEIFRMATEERGLEYDDYVKNVFFGSQENALIIAETVEKCLIGWKKERISYVSRAILTLSAYELMFMDDIPVFVSINEAVELSKKYDEDKAYSFVNGVLNALAESLKRK